MVNNSLIQPRGLDRVDRYVWLLRPRAPTREGAFANVEHTDLGRGRLDGFAVLIELLIAQRPFGFLL
jgi:hypothetical protein